MRRTTFFIAIALLMVSVATSCCPCRKGGSTADFNLLNTSWQLTQLNSRGVTAVEDQYTLSLGEDDRASGRANCNQITGTYTFSTEARSLTFSHMGMTRMMCPPGADLEDEYGQMLGKVTHYEVDGDLLMLLSKGQTVGVLRRL